MAELFLLSSEKIAIYRILCSTLVAMKISCSTSHKVASVSKRRLHDIFFVLKIINIGLDLLRVRRKSVASPGFIARRGKD